MNLNFCTYQFPFRQRFSTASQQFSDRKGVFITLEKKGITAMGEAAPLPGFSRENFNDLLQQIDTEKSSIADFLQSSFSRPDVYKFLESHSFYPSLQFGLFTLAVSYLAQKKRVSLHNLLFDSATAFIPVNAVISLNKKQLNQTVAQRVEKGFSTVKIKVDHDLIKKHSELKDIRQTYPDLNIRIDANRSWTLEEAKSNFSKIEALDIEYCEEPLSNPNKESIIKLGENTSIPIALDESLSDTFKLEQATDYAPVLIIKPMVLGLPAFSESLKAITAKNNTKLVYTTSLESGIGRLMTATLAAGFGSKKTAHGLNTGSLLATDIWEDEIFIKNGYYYLPKSSELIELMNRDLTKLPIQKL